MVLVLSAAAALAKNERKLAITNDALVSGKMLRAGKYNVGWVSQSRQATITFYSGKEALTTVEGKWVDRRSEYKQDMVMYANHPDGSKSIVEIHFAGMSRALVLGSEADAS